MTHRAAAVAALVLVFALAGCSGANETAPTSSGPAPSLSATPSETPETLTAEKPNAEAPADADAKFLAHVRDNVLPETQIPNATDEQLIAAGHDACDQLAAGTAYENVRVVENETPHPSTGGYYDTSAIMGGAVLYYCPEFG